MLSIGVIIASLLAVNVNRSFVLFTAIVILLARFVGIPLGGYYRDKMKKADESLDS